MRAYLRILLLRWARSATGTYVLIGAAAAPLAFNLATYIVFIGYRPSEMNTGAFTALITSAAFFSCLTASVACVHLLTSAIHTEKQENRIRLLRSSGFEIELAIACYLVTTLAASLVLVPLTLVGVWLLTVIEGVPSIGWSFVAATIAVVNVLGPIVIASRLALPQAFSITASYLAAFVLVILHSHISLNQHFRSPPATVIHWALLWALATALLVLAAVRDRRGENRLWL